MNIVALDIGGTSIKSGMVTAGKLQQKKETPSQAELGGAHIMQMVKEIIRGYSGYSRIGISTASQVDSDQGLIRYANNNIPQYTGTKVREILQEEFGVPVAVENDVNAAAMGEALWGAGKKAENGDFLCLTYGTGIGGAVVLDGKIYKGAAYSAGEFGHIITHADCIQHKGVQQGYYEKHASTNALVQKAAAVDPALDDGRKIFMALDTPAVRAAVDEWVDEVLFGLAALVHIFNPSLMVLGGGIMNEAYILSEINRKIGQYIMPSYSDVKIVPAKLGNDAGLLGVSHLAAML